MRDVGEKRERERNRQKRWRRSERGESGLIPEEGERRFVFLSLPMYRGGFHFESSITAGDQSQLNSSDECAARYKKKRKTRKAARAKSREGGEAKDAAEVSVPMRCSISELTCYSKSLNYKYNILTGNVRLLKEKD